MKINTIRSMIFAVAIAFIAISYCPASEPEQSVENEQSSNDQGAFIYLKAKPGATSSYAILSPPETVEDKQWKALYALTAQTQKDVATLTNQLDSYLKILGESSEETATKDALLRHIIKTLAPALKPFELNAIPTKNKSGSPSHTLITFTSPCLCCGSARYHLKKATTPGEMRASINLISDIQASTGIEADTLQAHSEIVQKGLSTIAPTLAKKYSLPNPERIDLLAGIFSLGHEMAHIARLDPLEQAKNPEPGYSKRIKKEAQADLISLLILRDEKYFVAAVNLFAKFFLIGFLEQVAFLLHSDPDNDALLEELQKAHNMTGHRSFIKMKKNTYRMQIDGATHPLYFKRIQDILTTWAAFLVYAQEEPLSVPDAIAHVAKQSTALFKGLGVTNEHVLQLLLDIVNDWKKQQLLV